VQHLAPGGGERRGDADPRHAGDRVRPAAAALLETREGEKRTVVELEVDEIGPSLRYATAKVNKVSRGSGSGSGGGGFGASGGQADDPWGSAPPAGAGGGADDEPPF
jgi:single-stranded DNA-binding protein